MLRIGRLLGLATVACALHAAVKLPALIADHMVLQQGMPVRIWGSADPGESVKVDFQGQSVTVKAARKRKVDCVAEAAGGGGSAGDDDQQFDHQRCFGGRGVAGVGAIEHGVSPADGGESRRRDRARGLSDDPPVPGEEAGCRSADGRRSRDVAGVLAGVGEELLGGGVFLRPAFAAESARADGADRERLGRDAGAIVARPRKRSRTIRR